MRNWSLHSTNTTVEVCTNYDNKNLAILLSHHLKLKAGVYYFTLFQYLSFEEEEIACGTK